MSYRLEHRIHTLAQNCIDGTSASRYAFTVEDVTFSQWPAGGTNRGSISTGWLQQILKLLTT